MARTEVVKQKLIEQDQNKVKETKRNDRARERLTKEKG